MNDFKVVILGNGSAVPTSWHKPSAQVVNYKGKQFLLDCGEGTQMQMIKYNQKRKNLDHIFISHLHGDHYYGLIGLLNSLHLMRREKPLTIFAPKELKQIIDLQLKVSNTTLFFPLKFQSLEDCKLEPLYVDEDISVSAFPLKHSVPVWGFLFKEAEQGRNIDKSFIKEHQPGIEQLKAIVKGGDFLSSTGVLLKNDEITLPPKTSRSYAYCTDTAPLKSTVEFVRNINLLYHESTFDSSCEELAEMTLHSTAAQAAAIAKEARASKLLLGHYSARFKELENLLDEARSIFPQSYLSKEGEMYEL